MDVQILWSFQCPNPERWSQKMDAAQRKMIRRIVGWRRVSEESWETTMSRMKVRVDSALNQWYIKPWSQCVAYRRWQHGYRIKSMPSNSWVSRCCRWCPQHIFDESLGEQPHRERGRPFLKWDVTLHNFPSKHSRVVG